MMTFTKTSMDLLTDRLSLPATGHEQDWDVELADPDRLKEFLETYYDPSLTADDRSALAALLLASVDRYLMNRDELPAEWGHICELLRRDKRLHRELIQYWNDEESEPENAFRLTPHLRQAMVVEGT
jgi:hypothetical protein